MLKKFGTALAMAAVLLVGTGALAEPHKLTGGRHPPRPVTGVININAATAAQLDMLPGIGRHTAGQIVAFREKQPFKAAEDLVKVKGVSQRTLGHIKSYLTVSGPTTLAYAAKSPGASNEGAARQVN